MGGGVEGKGCRGARSKGRRDIPVGRAGGDGEGIE